MFPLFYTCRHLFLSACVYVARQCLESALHTCVSGYSLDAVRNSSVSKWRLALGAKPTVFAHEDADYADCYDTVVSEIDIFVSSTGNVNHFGTHEEVEE